MSASEQDHLQRLASEFGKRVREHREERDLTQEAAAIMTGISITTYQKIEQGVRMPRLENVVKVIHGLKIDPGYLFAGLPVRRSGQADSSCFAGSGAWTATTPASTDHVRCC
ncbi:helix-turn-helix domain-containing protein [Mycobacteroides abscessus]|uniref:helix-turn-helix domain-containing protein n=1 Tax=Mycobacteroides abscessus TaxID=36809 RepID=UPI0002E6A2AB|nr:helix-turn-helix transcriptional regulator [Mycobacteroides abscessus]